MNDLNKLLKGFAPMFLVVWGIVAQAQPKVSLLPEGVYGKDYNVLDGNGKRNGVWYRIYKNKPDVLYYRGQYDHGKPVGVWDFYDQESRLISQVDHIQDSTINTVKMFYANGQVMAEGMYLGAMEDGKWKRTKEGLWKLYHQNGTLSTIENLKNGHREGIYELYLANGTKVSSCFYLNGELHGLYEEWNESGKKIRECNYEKGSMHGMAKHYFDDGKLKMQGEYYYGSFDKVWKIINAQGKQEAFVHYDKGKLIKKIYINADVEEYYESGIPKLICTYVDGKKEGPYKEYYDVGKFELLPGSEEDKKIGIYQREKLMGTVAKIEGEYLNDHFEGKIIFRKPNGDIEKIEHWENGKLIDEPKN